ncbi:MAG: ATP-binding protein, partial [Planctomycetota bacterium]
MRTRYLSAEVREDLDEKMVFIGGPRQVGKTTLSLSLLPDDQDSRSPAYLNWDVIKDRELLLSGELPTRYPRLILDEIHKFSDWRGLVKGFYDTYKGEVAVIVTGSARLDYYRKGGDSLQGRYHYYRLHPFTVNEADPE